MNCLGRMGRWGNQVFEYTFLRSYAEKYGLDYQCNPWVGQSLFGFQDQPITEKLPRYTERNTFLGGKNRMSDVNVQWNHTLPPDSREVIDHDFRGYAQYHTSYYRLQQQFICSLFARPIPGVVKRLDPVTVSLKRDYSEIIGIHLRRGDTGHGVFYLTPNQWYLDWLQEHWSRFRNPCLFIATEEPSDIEAFRQYNPITSNDSLALTENRYNIYNYLRCDLENPTAETMDWFPDWWLLCNCHILLIGESTFSFSAAMMNPFLQECWRSMLSKQEFVQIDPWDSYPLVREHLDDHPNIPNTFYKENPKWGSGELVQ